MKTETRQQLFDFIKQSGAISPAMLAELMGISPQMVHRHLNKLVDEGVVVKLGRSPKVLYRTVDTLPVVEDEALPPDLGAYINQHYLTVTPSGEVIEGVKGFRYWAQKTNQDKTFLKLAKEYVSGHEELVNKYKNEQGLIDARFKIADTFEDCYLDFLYYKEFYRLPKFGKTRTGQLIFLGKSGQDIDVIRNLAMFCRNSILAIIDQHRIDAVVFVPHSIPRKVSFLKEFEKTLSLSKPTIKLLKVFSGKTPVAQKSLQKLKDRIENANTTIYVKEQNLPYKNVLVIDDAVGSGATLNAIAEKLKRKGVSFVCGYAVTGSLKGFEVLNEI